MTKLKELHKLYQVPTVRKPPPEAIIISYAEEKLAEDVTQCQGPSTIKQLL